MTVRIIWSDMPSRTASHEARNKAGPSFVIMPDRLLEDSVAVCLLVALELTSVLAPIAVVAEFGFSVLAEDIHCFIIFSAHLLSIQMSLTPDLRVQQALRIKRGVEHPTLTTDAQHQRSSTFRRYRLRQV
jgi:hypothetical protein